MVPNFGSVVKKSPKEVAALRKEAAERTKIRKERREEQERNVAKKKKAAEGDDDDDEDEEGTDAGEPGEAEDWNADEEMSEGEDQEMSEEDVSESEEETEKAAPPRKRVKVGNSTKPQPAIRFRK